MTIGELLEGMSAGGELDNGEIAFAMQGLLGGFTSAQAGAFLAALNAKGVSESELAAFALEIRKRAVKVNAPLDAIDTCGTGGDGRGTFNISTACALVAAGAGACVAKHGNRSATSKCGSADVMEALGVNVDVGKELAEKCLREAGICFLFAPIFHPAMKAIAPVRRELGVKTVFNLLGPLANPAGVKRQVIGVYDKQLLSVFAGALLRLGVEHAVVVYGGGMDELSLSGANEVVECKNGEIKRMKLDAAEFGFLHAPASVFRVNDAKESAERVLEVLNGRMGPSRDVVLLNAGTAVYVSGRAGSIADGIGLAEEAIESGKALEVLEELRVLSNKGVV